MQACKSQYDYTQLVFNYIEYNLAVNKDITVPSITDKFTSTAKGRLSFDGPYLVSYSTRVAKFIHTKKATYILTDVYKYSNTTSKQINILRNYLPNHIIAIGTTSIDYSFSYIKDYYFTCIYDTYTYCKRARNGKHLQYAIETHKSVIRSIILELHPSTRKVTLRKLNTLPSIPDKLNKFTRPIILSILKDKGLLWQTNMNLLMRK